MEITGAVIVSPIIAILTGTTVATITVADAERTVEGAGAGAGATPGPHLTTNHAAGILTVARRVAGYPNAVPPLLLKRTGWSTLPAGEPSLEIILNDRAPQEIQILFRLVELNTEVT